MTASTHTRMSSLAAGAAVSVIVFSMVGVAAMTGLLPAANSQKVVQKVEPLAQTGPVTPPVAVPPAARKAPQSAERLALAASPSNETRMKGDAQYALGWRDGNDICKRR